MWIGGEWCEWAQDGPSGVKYHGISVLLKGLSNDEFEEFQANLGEFIVAHELFDQILTEMFLFDFTKVFFLDKKHPEIF